MAERSRPASSAGPSSIFTTALEVRRAMEKKLAGSGLTANDIKKLGYRPYSAQEAMSLSLPVFKAGFLLPYFSLEGNPTQFWRYRYLEPTKTGFDRLTSKKEMKYTQPSGTLNEVYLPPYLPWKKISQSPTVSLLITEGELKSACAAKNGVAALGLGGVWNWRAASAGLPFLPALSKFSWSEREVTIMFDSDAATNPNVLGAENMLARELLKHGAVVRIARLPKLEGADKTGLDDFIMSEGKAALLEIAGAAEDWELSAELHALNDEVVYARNPGIIVTYEERNRLSPSAFTEHAFAPRIFYVKNKDGKLVEKSAAKEWLKWAGRAEVKRLTYAPGDEVITINNEFNLWEGWGCLPKAGSIAPFRKVVDTLFSSDPAYKRWFEQWLAYPIQHPGYKLHSAPVLWGPQGAGKSLVGYTMKRIYGTNFVEISDTDLSSSYNEWATNKQFVLGDEIVGGDKRGTADSMKRTITKETLRINIKYVPSYEVPDCINYYFTSNHPDSFFLEDDDRRFFIHEVPANDFDTKFFNAYYDWLDNKGGKEAVFDYLLNLDLTGFEPKGHAPRTLAKEHMIDLGRSDLGSWVAALREDPDTVLRMGNAVINRALWTVQELLALYDPNEKGRVTANGLARELKRAGFARAAGGVGIRTENGQFKMWILRDRAKYVKMSGAQIATAYAAETLSRKKGKYEK